MLLWESLLSGGTIPATPLLFVWGAGEAGQLADATSTGSPLNISTARSWSQITAGLSAAAGITSDGLLFTWGNPTNSSGVNTGILGQGNNLVNFSPTQIGTNSWISVSMARDHVLAIRQGGTLFTWGQNDNGQLGLGDTVNRSSPTQIGTSSWVALGTFGYVQSGFNLSSSAAIRQGGTLFTWGANQLSNLGDGSNINRSSPHQIGSSSWIAVSMGVSNTAAIRQGGTLFTWGSSSGGKLGNYINGTTPPTAQSWRDLTFTNEGGAGIDSLGRLWVWGWNNGEGWMGLNDIIARSSPTQVGTSSWTQVAMATNILYAIRQGGGLFATGRNDNGQLGLGDNVRRSSPTQIGTSSWTQIIAGDGIAGAIRQDGRLFLWGQTSNGQVPNEYIQFRSSPTQIGTSSWSQVGLNGAMVLARRNDNTIWSWGNNNEGQLGLANSDGVVLFSGQSWTVLDSTWDNETGFGINTAGQLWSWGRNTFGLQGRSLPNTSSIESAAAQIGNSSWLFVTAGNNEVSALTLDRRLFVWGRNGAGQLGLGDTIARNSPVQVGTSSWSTVSMGASHTLAVQSDGTLWAWGANNMFQLGNGTQTNVSSPVQIMPIGSFSFVAAGWNHSMALSNDGRLYTWGSVGASLGTNVNFGIVSENTMGFWLMIDGAKTSGSHVVGVQEDNGMLIWGANQYGQLGLGNTVSTSEPTRRIPGTWTSLIAAGSSHTTAINTAGTLFVWGRNDQGQLGLGDTNNRSSPTQLGTSSWIQVYANMSYTAAIRQDGRLFVWGNNQNGRLGMGDNVNRSSPTQLGTSSWTMVDLGESHVMGVRQGGTMFTWGNNVWGVLGLSDQISRSSPTQVGTSSWLMVSAGKSISAAIRASDRRGFTWGLNGFYGALGQGSQVDRSSPVAISESQQASWISVASGGGVILLTNGQGYGWGENFNGTYMYQWTNNPQRDPIQWWALNDTNAKFRYTKSIDEGVGTLAITSSPSAAANNRVVYGGPAGGLYGLSSLAQNGSPADRPRALGTKSRLPVPVQLWPRASYILVSAGSEWGLYRDATNNFAYSWGDNSNGRLGVGDTVNRSSPSQISAQNPTKIKTRGDRGIVVGFFGRVQVWGNNNVGQGGLNPNTDPFVTSPLDPWPFLWPLGTGDFMINSQGTLVSSTRTGFSQLEWLGQNSWANPAYWTGEQLENRSSPSITSVWSNASPNQIGLSSWTWISSGQSFNGAVRTDRQLFMWGRNFWGQLGLGDNIARSSPTQVSLTVDRIATGGLWTQTWNSSTSALNFAGYNNEGAGGLGDLINRSQFTAVTQPDASWGPPPSPGVATTGATNWGFKGSTNSWTALSWGSTFTVAISQNWWTTNTTPSVADVAIINSPVQVGTLSWSQVGIGQQFSVGRDSANRIYTWGINVSNQGALGLGLSISTARGSPMTVGTSSYTQISAGSDNVLAIKIDGTLVGWGINSNFQLGTNDATSPRSSPVAAAAGSWSQVRAGPSNMLGISSINGWLYGWSSAGGTQGQGYSPITVSNLRLPRLIYQSLRRSPVQLGTASWRQISNGYLHSLAISNDRKLWAWGNNNVGQLGLVNTLASGLGLSSPVQIGTDNWDQVTAGQDFSLAIRSDGTLWSWGLNNTGQLGLNEAGGTWPARSSPTQIGSLSWKSVVAGGTSYAFAIRSDGTLWTWGSNAGGILGLGNTVSHSSPVQIGTSSWTAVAGYTFGTTAAAAIRSDGALFTWGQNVNGQLGLQDDVNRSSPTQLGTSSWIAVSMGRSHVLGLTRISANRGTLFGWGSKIGGAIGNGDTTGRSWNWLAMSNTTYAIDSTGLLWGAGRNSSGELGLGDTIGPRSSLTQISNQQWLRVAPSQQAFTIAIRQNGTLWGWGNNNQGYLGLGDLVNRSSPTQIGTSSWTQVSASNTDVFAIRQDGTLWHWGAPNAGTQGSGSSVPRSSPTQIGSSVWTAVSCASNSVAAIRQGGTLFVWGQGSYGLGLGDNISRSSPTQLGTSSWVAVSTDQLAYQAIRQGGTMFTWGLNNVGQLGLNDVVDRSSPTQVGTSSWTAISSYTTTSTNFFGIINGALYAWGNNANSSLGLGDNIRRSSPTLVTSEVTSWTAVVTGGTNSSGGISNQNQIWGWGLGSMGMFGNQVNTGSVSPIIIGAAIQFKYFSPVQVGSQQWKTISAGDDVSAAINEQDLLYTWGLDANGYLGGPGAQALASRSSPVQLGTSTWSSINMGYRSITGITK